MATTKIWAVRSRLDHLVGYVSNTEKTVNPSFGDLQSTIEYAGADYKTEKRFYVSGINCQPETAYIAMSNALKMTDKKIRVLAYHGYQSFAKDEVNAETAHEIGVKLARELWGDRFQVVVATHLNTEHDYWKDAGTPVSRGETGIRISPPGKEYLREDKTIGVSMNSGRVFDISQTSARNKLRQEPKHDTRTLPGALMSHSPAPIRLVDAIPDGVGARYNEQSNITRVVRGLDGDSLFRCMAQEIAYANLDRVVADSTRSFPPKGEKLARSVAPPSPTQAELARGPRDTDALTCQDKGFAAYAASYALCVKLG